MAVYKNTNTSSPLASVEFTPVSDGNFTFFHARAGADIEAFKAWITSAEMGQNVVAQTVVSGETVFITHGDTPKDAMLKQLETKGEQLSLQAHKKPFNWWALRGGLSIAGQTLHFASALLGVEQLKAGHAQLDPKNAHFNPKLKEGMYVRKAFQTDIGVFAVLNQTANLANILYGGQEENAENRLHAVKGEINGTLADHLAAVDNPINVLEKRSDLRKDPEGPQTAMQKADEFTRKYSVRFFEIGLRVVGTMALIVPWKNIPKGLNALKKGQMAEAWKVSKNPDKNYFNAGMLYMGGKIMSFCAKVPDPYDDKPHTLLDTVREKYLFRLGTAMEAWAGGTMAHNAFTNKKWGFSDPNRPDIKPNMDYLSGVGGSLFVMGFGARFFAPYGKRQVDMEEVYAHAADTLAKTPPEKLPQLMADTAATLKEHFKDKQVDFSEIYTKMMTDMYRYHHVALDNLGTEPDERAAKMKATEKAPEPALQAADAKFSTANPSRTLSQRVPLPATAHTDKALDTAGTPQVVSL